MDKKEQNNINNKPSLPETSIENESPSQALDTQSSTDDQQNEQAKTTHDDGIQPSGSEHTADHANNHNPTKKNKSCKLSGLALLLSILAVAGTGYNYYTQNFIGAQSTDETTNKQLRNDIAQLQDQINTHQALTEDQIQTLITQQIKTNTLSSNQIKEMVSRTQSDTSNNQEMSASEIKQLIADQINQYAVKQADISNNQEMSASEIKQLIADQLNQYAVKQADHLSAIASTAESANYDAQIKTINTQIKNLQTQANTSKQANPAPIISALTMANIANKSGNYRLSLQYIDQALAAYDLYKLNGSSYGQFKNSIQTVQKQLQSLNEKTSRIDLLRQLISESDQWPIKAVNKSEKNKNDSQATTTDSESEDFGSKVLSVGETILAKSFTVTDLSAPNIAWINADSRLASIIHENIRLDLMAAQNAAIINDTAMMNQLIGDVQLKINNYLEAKNNKVSAAIKILDDIKSRKNNAPDIDRILKSINQIGGVNND